MLIRVLTAIVATVALSGSALAQQEQSCGRETFSKAVDDAAAVLRRHSSETQPRIQAGIRQLKTRHGWRDEEEAERARELLANPESEALDHKAAQLLAAMDRLSEEGNQRPGDCAKLAELRATASALSTTVRRKSDLALMRIDAALALPPGGRLPRPSETAQPKAPSLSAAPRIPSAAQPIDAVRPIVETRAPETASAAASAPWTAPWAAPLVPPPAAAVPPLGQWTVTTTPEATTPPAGAVPPLPEPRRVAAIAPTVAAIPPTAKPGNGKPAGETYSIDEIKTVARGGLPNWSASVGSVIEHAFSNYGRPTAYVIGEEGGGAFIAGVRYGKGKLYMKGKPVAKIYWHGPSVGYDFGAAGSQTLFLIYGMREARDLYRGFSGIDGSAYFIGGAGITFLSNQEIIMAPIRTGLGFRLGASVGYLRFSSKSTWNPF
ncbi:EipA family protein [Hyphomicrobium sp. CS1BSMeth3]|uniref:EipA family protein n=1 Tax=Hyphomicrobium sp. CS1BSMeth3 TaxID=1892844 RepID=UPI000B2577A8|nr:EipA family protein [Hyphomicrobium sp. CS1BSMeth3]